MDLFGDRNIKSKSAFSLSNSEEKAFGDSSESVFLEPVQPEAYELSYTCLLIPRLPSHKLKAELANNLPQWLQRICVLYNWQVEFITVEPDYFQWGLRVVPSTQTGQFMQEIREGTSELILSTFEHIRNENSTDDFWASGYLVVLGTRPHPKEMIEQYIRLSRRQQGLSAA
jgi:REP element-mobilizing transposase RayT